jgi:hypothetical protein
LASHLELMIRQLRSNLQEQVKLRYISATTTSDGATDGTSIVSTNLQELVDSWNGAEALLTSGSYSGQSRKVEDFTATTDTLSFTNDPWPTMVASGVTFELAEAGVFSHYQLKQYLIQAINFMAGLLPKTVLRNYIRKAPYTSSSGAVAIDINAVDIHMILINGKPGIQIPPERNYRMLSGKDAFLEPTTSDRYLYYFRGASASASELVHAPAVSASIAVHYIPNMTDFESDGSTTWPRELWPPAINYATGLALLANEDVGLAQGWLGRAQDEASAKGAKAKFVSRQEKGV